MTLLSSHPLQACPSLPASQILAGKSHAKIFLWRRGRTFMSDVVERKKCRNIWVVHHRESFQRQARLKISCCMVWRYAEYDSLDYWLVLNLYFKSVLNKTALMPSWMYIKQIFFFFAYQLGYFLKVHSYESKINDTQLIKWHYNVCVFHPVSFHPGSWERVANEEAR